jgi:hypothetical protein
MSYPRRGVGICDPGQRAVPWVPAAFAGGRNRDTKVAKASRAEVAVSVTGIAGPDGGTTSKPVSLVHFACGREAVRLASVRVGLDLLAAAGDP